MRTEQGLRHIPYRPLGMAKEVVESIGDRISYVYEDLVFVEHSSFLLQFGEVGAEIFFYRNTETAPDEAEELFRRLCLAAGDRGLSLSFSGSYSSRGNDDETVSLEFYRSVR